jgi:hypothetical protein
MIKSNKKDKMVIQYIINFNISRVLYNIFNHSRYLNSKIFIVALIKYNYK